MSAREGGTLKVRMSASRPFVFEHPPHARLAVAVLRRLPPFAGQPIRIQYLPGLRDPRGEVHAGAFLRERRVVFNCTPVEFGRVFVHEVFHFVWWRIGNARRESYEEILRAELRARARGELGWSAEWRKQALGEGDVRQRSRRWREYCCESFCDSAAWLYSGLRHHAEFTLAGRFRASRHRWLAVRIRGCLSI